MTKIIEMSQDEIVNSEHEISEQVAHSLIAQQEKVLMIFERTDKSLYWYIATQFTDLWHAKKTTLNKFLAFHKTSR